MFCALYIYLCRLHTRVKSRKKMNVNLFFIHILIEESIYTQTRKFELSSIKTSKPAWKSCSLELKFTILNNYKYKIVIIVVSYHKYEVFIKRKATNELEKLKNYLKHQSNERRTPKICSRTQKWKSDAETSVNVDGPKFWTKFL